ncbi:Uncharacterised protein [[Clostridium] sordellii]|uniref:Uncharacterized protein n=1 Tax=Paraclostridium sordellii TaxID=1505 RepID=A0ABM9RPE2_PARSO|nr:hypothetical protein [Paeniclostridium sordellii]CEJ73912.1 hypothetical protein ATCC9714_18001 [[Clostridium] sordellii] [Paeniclostridium sordellii]CEN69457.1 Uncharacterised protein [[Clostridium] sordellii] [Paeniclostridium sordellii]CEN72725.1 Uncharacterised protein [[Clostridium] sordellii] [Paeniclostridium sordellii]CEO24574.1 Uncharacterised protein [[Clostridium] sordellii] [Paeniclostridium sordellii]CEP75682.1 Uncharacterised protein [[Clostridium] sordellii] [Paeniclostridium
MKSKNILSIALSSLIILTMLSTSVSAHTQIIDKSISKANIEKVKLLRRECFIKSVEELKNSGILIKEDVDNINDYIIKLQEENKRKSSVKNYYRGNKESKIKEKKYNNNNDRKKSLIDNMVKDRVITKYQGEKLKETIRKNKEKMKNDIEKN